MRIFAIFFVILLSAYLWNINAPLQGTHAIRQADTIFAAYSYCVEDSEYLKPKIAHRGLTEGIAIGEFPLYSILLSLPCEIRGFWSEWDPKIWTLLLLILNLLIWGRWARLYFAENKTSQWVFLSLLTFSTFGLLFMTISIPDNLAFILVGLAAAIKQQAHGKKWRSALALFLFLLAFAIRPYFIPLAWLVSAEWVWLGLVGLGSLAIYFFWYKGWAPLYSQSQYYYTAIPPLRETILTLPKYGGELLLTILREGFHYVFILLLIWKWRFLKGREILGFLFSLALVIAVRGEHLVVHSYYLWAAATFAFVALTRAISSFSIQRQNILLVVFILMGIAQTQHQFHRQAEARSNNIKDLLAKNSVPSSARIAVYVGEGSCSTHYLYWMKHLGWCRYEQDFTDENHCPSGADYYFRYLGDEPILNPCISSPTHKPIDR